MPVLFKFLKKKLDKGISDALYEDYIRTCRYTGELPLNKDEYAKRFNKNKNQKDE